MCRSEIKQTFLIVTSSALLLFLLFNLWKEGVDWIRCPDNQLCSYYFKKKKGYQEIKGWRPAVNPHPRFFVFKKKILNSSSVNVCYWYSSPTKPVKLILQTRLTWPSHSNVDPWTQRPSATTAALSSLRKQRTTTTDLTGGNCSQWNKEERKTCCERAHATARRRRVYVGLQKLSQHDLLWFIQLR